MIQESTPNCTTLNCLSFCWWLSDTVWIYPTPYHCQSKNYGCPAISCYFSEFWKRNLFQAVLYLILKVICYLNTCYSYKLSSIWSFITEQPHKGITIMHDTMSKRWCNLAVNTVTELNSNFKSMMWEIQIYLHQQKCTAVV